MAPATDRLSSLPESLTTAILSLLPTKDAVRTSALSRHWRHSWLSLPNIVIHHSHFPSLPACLYFAIRRLLNYPLYATVDTFSLTLPPPDPQLLPLFSSFLRFALSRETKSLELDFAGPARAPARPSFILPAFVYEYDGLDALSLFSCRFNVTDFVNLSWLKTASFGCIEFPNDALRALLMGSPLLETLSLFKCDEATEYCIVSTKLTSLTLDNCVDLTNVTIIAPNLRRFKYVGAMVEFGMVNLAVLEEADLDLGLSPFYDEEIGDSVRDFLMNFHNARVLRVCSYITQILATASEPWQLPRHIGAKHLILESAFHLFEYVGIACLLKSSPSLQKIQFNIAPRQIFQDDNDHPCAELDPETFWGEDFQAPKCMTTTLQEVEMNGIGGSDNELRFLKFLFKFGLVLRTVRLRLAKGDDGGSRVQLFKDLSRILRSWRSKSVCQPNILID